MVKEGGHNMDGVGDVQSLSALMDGELDGEQAGHEIFRLKTDAPARQAWDTYHLIGDAMRGNALNVASGATFGLRFSERLAQEPTVLAPVTNLTNVGRVHDTTGDIRAGRIMQPSRKMQTYALSAAASVAAVAVVGWAALNLLKPDDATPFAAKLTTAPVAVQPSQPVAQALPPLTPVPQVQPASLAAAEPVQEYLMAHQGISPSTAIQGVTPYVRTISSAGE